MVQQADITAPTRTDRAVAALEAMSAPRARQIVSARRLQEFQETIQRKLDRRREQWDQEETELRRVMAASGGGDWDSLMGRLGVRGGAKTLLEAGGTPAIAARFDTALTTEDNRLHWAMADALAADASMNPGIRFILRNRSRYEVANNSYARGIVNTLANDVIGTGPRLQLLTANPFVNRRVEREFNRWARAVGLAEKLRTMRKAKCQDGETFALLVNNPGVDHPCKLDVRVIEADQVRTTDLGLYDVPTVDGMRLDVYGNPVEYHVLRVHPGTDSYQTGTIGFPWEYDVYPAASVIHWFRQDRPGQHRGIPEITPALPLFAQLRRYTLAVLDAAEAAADHAIVLYTTAPANQECQPTVPMDIVELERRMMTTLPEGWQAGQIDAKQPTTTYAEFKKEILNEIARCLSIPYNVAAGNSSGYNYASGRLDHQTYFKELRVDQKHCEAVVLDRIFNAWLDEAILVTGLLPLPARTFAWFPRQWFWDGHEHVDPLKEASAQEKRLQNNTTTLADEYARKGQDWETQVQQRAKEVALLKKLGLTPAQALPAPRQADPSKPPEPAPVPSGGGEGDDEPDDDDEPAVDESEDI